MAESYCESKRAESPLVDVATIDLGADSDRVADAVATNTGTPSSQAIVTASTLLARRAHGAIRIGTKNPESILERYRPETTRRLSICLINLNQERLVLVANCRIS